MRWSRLWGGTHSQFVNDYYMCTTSYTRFLLKVAFEKENKSPLCRVLQHAEFLKTRKQGITNLLKPLGIKSSLISFFLME